MKYNTFIPSFLFLRLMHKATTVMSTITKITITTAPTTEQMIGSNCTLLLSGDNIVVLTVKINRAEYVVFFNYYRLLIIPDITEDDNGSFFVPQANFKMKEL